MTIQNYNIKEVITKLRKENFKHFSPKFLFDFSRNVFYEFDNIKFIKKYSEFIGNYFEFKNIQLSDDSFFLIRQKEVIISDYINFKIREENYKLYKNDTLIIYIKDKFINVYKNYRFKAKYSIKEIEEMEFILNQNLCEVETNFTNFEKLKKFNIFSITETLLSDIQKNYTEFFKFYENKEYFLKYYVNYKKNKLEEKLSLNNYIFINNFNLERGGNDTLKIIEKNNSFKKLQFYDNTMFSGINFFVNIPEIELNKSRKIFKINKNVFEKDNKKDKVILLKTDRQKLLNNVNFKLNDYIISSDSKVKGLLFLNHKDKKYQNIYVDFKIEKYSKRIIKEFFDLENELEKYYKKYQTNDTSNLLRVKIENNKRLKINNKNFQKIPGTGVDTIHFEEIKNCEVSYFVENDFDKDFRLEEFEDILDEELPININYSNYLTKFDISENLKKIKEKDFTKLDYLFEDKKIKVTENFKVDLEQIKIEKMYLKEKINTIIDCIKPFKKLKVGNQIIEDNFKETIFSKISPKNQELKTYYSNNREENNLYNLKVGNTLLSKKDEIVFKDKRINVTKYNLVFGKINGFSINNFKDFKSFSIKPEKIGKVILQLPKKSKFIKETEIMSDKEIEDFMDNNIGKHSKNYEFIKKNIYETKVGKFILVNGKETFFDLKTNFKTNLNKYFRIKYKKNFNIELYKSKIGKDVLYNNKNFKRVKVGYSDSKKQYIEI